MFFILLKLVFYVINDYLCGMNVCRLLLLSGLLYVAMPLLGQERADSLMSGTGLSAEEIEELTRPLDPQTTIDKDPLTNGTGIRPVTGQDLLLEPVMGKLYQAPTYFHVTPARGSYLPRWEGGSMYGDHRITGDLLTGYSAVTQMGVQHRFGDYWQGRMGLSLMQVPGLYNVAQLNGSLTWQPNRHFGVTVFGSYLPGSFLSAVDVVPTLHWGGYVSLQSDGIWGIDLGAQGYYTPVTGSEVVPIVMPYVKLGEAKLGIDVGPMIRDALHHDRGRDNGFNPIPQPIKAVPQIAPRR